MDSEREIDLSKLLFAVLHHKIFILLVTVVFGVASFFITRFAITPQYRSSASIYVNNSKTNSSVISSGDLSAAQSLVETYVAIMSGNRIKDYVLEETGLDMSRTTLSACVNAAAVNDTEVLRFTVTHPDPEIAARIANAYVEVSIQYLPDIVEGSSVKVVDSADISTAPVSPSLSRNLLMAMILGFLLSVGVVVLRELLDNRIKSDEDLRNLTDLPLIGVIPNVNLASQNKAGYYSYGGSRGRNK